jgi:hypothetical protein
MSIHNNARVLSDREWKTIKIGFLSRLFSSGSKGLFAFGCIAALATLIVAISSPAHTYIPGLLAAVFLVLSLPNLLGLMIPYPLLILIGAVDGLLGVVLYILGFPLAFISMAWVLTDTVAVKIFNAAIWIFRHGNAYNSLVRELRLPVNRDREQSAIADGGLPGGNDGFWAAVSDAGPFWVFQRSGERILLRSSADPNRLLEVSWNELSKARLVVPRKVEDKKKRSEMLAYPMEHILIWKFSDVEGNDLDLTLILGPRAARIFADDFVSQNEQIRRVAAKTSDLAIVSGFLGLLGPFGLVLGIVSLARIKNSDHQLKGQFFSWLGIIAGLLFTVLILVASLAD